MKRKGWYIVVLYSGGKMLCSFITNLIGIEIESGEFLYQTVKKLIWREIHESIP
jgi:hypothetical protein